MTPRVASRIRTGESSTLATIGAAAGAVAFAAPAILPALARISSTRFMNFAAGSNLRLMVFIVAGAVEYHCCTGAHIPSTSPAVCRQEEDQDYGCAQAPRDSKLKQHFHGSGKNQRREQRQGNGNKCLMGDI